MRIKNNHAFSLVEILITVLIISILVIATILLLDPRTMINKGIDTRRKTELSTLKKKLEEYYTDKGCYPAPSEVCYSAGQDLTKTSCTICGTQESSPLLSPYFEDKLPCDPTHPNNVYLYSVNSITCPKSFVVYSKLDVPQDQDSINLGCGESGCGPSSTFGYDYGVSSPNTAPRKVSFFVCFTQGGTCDACGVYEDCTSSSNCTSVYSTGASCCAAHPGSPGC